MTSSITQEQLHETLGVMAQFEERGGQLVRVEPTENIGGGRQVRWRDNVYQFGLTSNEIDGIWNRLEDFLEKVDKGDYTVF